MPNPAFPKLYLRIAVPSPLRKCFDYLPLADIPLPAPGTRVKVRFGRQQTVGIVIAASTETEVPAAKLRPVEAVLDDEPLLDAEILALYRWASDYYLFPLGLALQVSLPKAMREGAALHEPGVPCWRTTAAGEQAEVADLARAPQQQAVLALLKTYRELTTSEASALLNKPSGPALKALVERGLIHQALRPFDSSFSAPAARSEALPLNAQQAAALAALRAGLDDYRCFLLEGITGSGKTEVYLQLIEGVLQRGRQVLVLVPEISLTPQTVQRFASRFQCRIAAFHSGLSDRLRCDGWLSARSGAADIVIGTRSAVFTPLPRLGLIVIDEEHDNSYKQQDGFRYSARDVAIWRASTLRIPIVLGSATPSLESLLNAQTGRYELLQLDARAGAAELPDLELLDMRLQGKLHEIREGFSFSLLQAIRRHLENGRQVLVFLNRRGFAPILLCRNCGWIAECPRCERSYTLHRQPPSLHCHHCEAQKPLPAACPTCNSLELSGMGLGTERSEDLLAQEFPDYPVIRIDRDTTRTKDSLENFVARINTGEPCILVGTQMLAKGHHFPRVTLVAVLDADSGLFSADFRGQENFGQLFTQVSGRAGRSDTRGQVLIQTWHPDHPVLQQLIREGYGPFARTLLEQRRAGGLPPFRHCLLLHAEASTRELPLQFLEEARELARHTLGRDADIYGPQPSPLGKRGGLFRAQLIMQSSRRAALHGRGQQLVTGLEELPLARKVRWTIDVDPLDFS